LLFFVLTSFVQSANLSFFESFSMDTSLPKLVQSTNSTTLSSLIGSPSRVQILDVRKAEDFALNDGLIPGAIRWDYHANPALPANLDVSIPLVAYCVKGAHVGVSAAEQLLAQGFNASYLEGGLREWVASNAPAVKKRPDLGVTGETVSRWVTRARPKIDRIACPWLIRRFIDPMAQFFYVPTNEVFSFAATNNAIAYDIPGALLEHNGPLCSFDSFLRAFEIRSPALDVMATIVRGADTDALELAPQSAGLLAFSLGLSRNITDDYQMLAAAMPMYDALYSWAQTVVAVSAEKHNWKPS
jgi:rhodanese-related sulfurtransferase